MEKVIRFLARDDLKNIRLSCKEWRAILDSQLGAEFQEWKDQRDICASLFYSDPRIYDNQTYERSIFRNKLVEVLGRYRELLIPRVVTVGRSSLVATRHVRLPLRILAIFFELYYQPVVSPSFFLPGEMNNLLYKQNVQPEAKNPHLFIVPICYTENKGMHILGWVLGWEVNIPDQCILISEPALEIPLCPHQKRRGCEECPQCVHGPRWGCRVCHTEKYILSIILEKQRFLLENKERLHHYLEGFTTLFQKIKNISLSK